MHWAPCLVQFTSDKSDEFAAITEHTVEERMTHRKMTMA